MTGPAEIYDDTNPARPGSRRPLGVRLLISLFWFWAGAITVLLLGLLLGEGPVRVYGRAVPRAEALRAVLPALLPTGLAVIGAALALTLGRPWARPAALFPFALAAFGPMLTGLGGRSPAELGLAALVLTAILAVLVWYLYFRPGPREYFRRSSR